MTLRRYTCASAQCPFRADRVLTRVCPGKRPIKPKGLRGPHLGRNQFAPRRDATPPAAALLRSRCHWSHGDRSRRTFGDRRRVLPGTQEAAEASLGETSLAALAPSKRPSWFDGSWSAGRTYSSYFCLGTLPTRDWPARSPTATSCCRNPLLGFNSSRRSSGG